MEETAEEDAVASSLSIHIVSETEEHDVRKFPLLFFVITLASISYFLCPLITPPKTHASHHRDTFAA